MAPKSIEIAVLDLTSHYYPLDEQRELTRRLSDADIRIWLTDQTLNWYPDGAFEPSPISSEWPKHAFWDRYVQAGILATEFPASRWAIALDVVRRSPDTMAQTMMTLHEWTGGRVLFALAAGEVKQLGPFGYAESKPFTRLEETMLLLRRLWGDDEPIDFEGKTLRYTSAYLGNRASDGTQPGLTTIGVSPRLRKVAARYGNYAPVGGTQEAVREQIAAFRAEAEAVGRDPDELKFWGSATRPGATGGQFTADTEEDAEAIRTSIMAKWIASGGSWRGWMDGDENVYGTDYNYAHDLVPTEWDVERVRGVLDRIPDDRVPITFSTEDDIVDRIVSSAEAGIDMIRFSDRSAEIHPAMRWRLTDLYVRAADRARAILAAG